MKYNIGDKVRVKSLEWYNANKDEYGVKFECNKNVYTAKGLDLIVTDEGDWEYAVTAKGIAPIEIDFIKPYLYPLSSMTKEQKLYLEWHTKYRLDDGELVVKKDDDDEYLNTNMYDYLSLIEWLNKNHFDYLGLIERGFAIDATNLNIY